MVEGFILKAAIKLYFTVAATSMVATYIANRWQELTECFLVQPLPGWTPIMGWDFLKTGFLDCPWFI